MSMPAACNWTAILSRSRTRKFSIQTFCASQNICSFQEKAPKRWIVPLRVAPEIIEDTNEVAIKIGGYELAQLPRFVFGFGNDLRARAFPLREEFVYLSFAIEIEPEKDRARVAVGLSE